MFLIIPHGNIISQLVIGTNGLIFFRYYKDEEFTEWQEIKTKNQFFIGDDNISSADLNDYTYNSIYSFAGNITEENVKNAPIYPFNGCVISLFASKNVGCQYTIIGNSNKMYVRSLYGSWQKWFLIANNSDISELNEKINELNEKIKTNKVRYSYSQNKLISCFHTVGCIGDSLSSGTCGDGDGVLPENLHDVYSISWGQCLARMTGNKYYNFSNRGLTTKTWLASKWKDEALSTDKKCDCYFIGLGVNDAYDESLPIGSISDIDVNDYSKNKDTFYGNYAKIISIMKNHVPLAKFFIFTMPRELDSTKYDEYNNAVRAIANLFDNVYLIDLVNDYYDEYKNGLIQNGYREGHYDAISYQLQANIIYEEVCKIMENNIDEFLQIELINEYNKYN